MHHVDTDATLNDQLLAHALLGRSYAKQGKGSAADREYGGVHAKWKRAGELDAKTGGSADQRRRLAKSLMAVGEAAFYFAEKKRAKAEANQFPQFRGSGELADVKKFIRSKVAVWFGHQRVALMEAERAYLEVMKLEPEPPPRLAIAASAAVGQMWSKFVSQFRAAPYPKKWTGRG